MKNKNAFVSQKEVVLEANTVLITKTDTKGIITYTNDEFCRIAGYTREELIGKSHNIVRHPDMPPAAFKWLWDTLRAERPWRGMVKNRCKNGDHYWVWATVAPLFDDGKVAGYVSVRRPPSRAKISQAENLYRELNQTGTEVLSKLEMYKFKNWSLRTKLQLLVQGTLLVVLSGAQFYIANTVLDEMKVQAVEKGEQLANEVIDSANMLMVAGQITDSKTRNLLMEKINSSKSVKSAMLVRAKPVVDIYGEGAPEGKIGSALQQKAISSGELYREFKDDADGNPVLHLVTPYRAWKDFHGTDCTGCHQVAENTVLGASDIVIDLAPDYRRFWRTERHTVLAQLFLHIFFLFFIGYLIRRYVTDPVREISQSLRDAMGGELNAELTIDVHDEVGDLMCQVQTLQCYLRTMVDSLMSNISHVRSGVGEVQTEVDQEMENVEIEQDRIQGIAATMEEFSQSISEVAGMAADSLAIMAKTQAIVDRNEINMQVNIDSSQKVADTVQNASLTIAELNQSIDKIGKIAISIKEIADQTNLLALNAAIEAARAGEQGRGFAVVADEVRKLAERTALSTKDIAVTIQEITAISGLAVQSMAGASNDVQSGINAVRQSGEGLKEIRAATARMEESAESIAQATQEQSAAGHDVANALEKITGLVDSNTAALQKTAQATEDLAKSADELNRAGYPLTKCAMAK